MKKIELIKLNKVMKDLGFSYEGQGVWWGFKIINNKRRTKMPCGTKKMKAKKGKRK